MKKKESNFFERTQEDDILDALSLIINKKLKTEKQIDDQKNNVYFWLWKCLLLLIYLLFINILFVLIKDLGVLLIYYFSTSLTSLTSLLYSAFTTFIQGIFTLYVLFKNLKIFMNSTYYKRLYSKDKTMNKKKKKTFNILYAILKYLSIPYLIVTSFLSATLLIILISLFYLMFHNIYSLGFIGIILSSFVFCYFLFRAIQNKFFEKKVAVTKKHFMAVFIAIFISLIIFGYETSYYEYDESLPINFALENKELYFDISDKEKVMIKSFAKSENLSIYQDNTLQGKIRIELSYFPTAKVSYTSFLNENDTLILGFDSKMNFTLYHLEDVLKLGIESLRKKTIYNYNLFKYPSIKIYASTNDLAKIKLLKYGKPFIDEFGD